ncbi:hypothetical protein [Criibacterium bergeronii]|uniref:Uncharacterized protein n=1 Tax=Criibacterium bergeronii TaxID=1871336 RepID=A0A1C0AG62_9FIRM|nr:hypothetical protein [Criibacterium bergeronii]RDY21425.1 hypothetical protein BBG48_004715 [Criibacterium bergeronii]
MKAAFPNLELIEHKATELALLDKALSSPPEFDLITFPQIWGSTCTGFDLTSDGLPAVSGSAMTKEYTTVAHELKTDVYYIFFGGRPCYKVTEAGKNFFSDLNSRNMASLSKAKDRYIDQKYKPGEEILTIIAELRGDIEELHSLLSYEFYCEMRDKIDEIETLILEVVKP